MSDYIVNQITTDGKIRAYGALMTQTVTNAQNIHDTWATSSAALGRTMIGTALLGVSGLKKEGQITVRLQGNGPVGAIVVDSDAHGHIKGYLKHPHVNLPLNQLGKIDVAGGVGLDGLLQVTKDLGLKEPFTGQVPIISGEIAEDFTYYLAKSEQIPSAVGLSVFVNSDNQIGAAGGFMIQVLPGADDKVLAKIEQGIANIGQLSDLLRAGKTPEQILALIFDDISLKTLDKTPISYQCDCSRERFLTALSSIAPKDLQEMIDEDQGAQAVCQFCGKKYDYSVQALENLLTNLTK